MNTAMVAVIWVLVTMPATQQYRIVDRFVTQAGCNEFKQYILRADDTPKDAKAEAKPKLLCIPKRLTDDVGH